MWWAVTTMTTVGYGDVYPENWLGRIVAAAAAFFGIATVYSIECIG
jgi:voltage-gated potassium channel Kch